MNNQEAKFILSSYRPNGADAGDALFQEALKQVRQDPALEAWLAREQAYDGIVTSKLGEINAPAGLREAILAGARVSQTKVHSWRQPWRIALGAAAAIALAGAAFLWSKRLPANADMLVELALQDTAVARHGGHGEKLTAAQEKLSDPTVHLGEGLKLDFAALRETGCRTVAMNGQEVFEICFNRNGTWFHLYAMAEPALVRAAGETGVKIVQREKFSCATWHDPSTGYRYAVVGDGGLKALQGLL